MYKLNLSPKKYNSYNEMMKEALKAMRSGIKPAVIRGTFDDKPFYDEYGRNIEMILKQEIL